MAVLTAPEMQQRHRIVLVVLELLELLELSELLEILELLELFGSCQVVCRLLRFETPL